MVPRGQEELGVTSDDGREKRRRPLEERAACTSAEDVSGLKIRHR